MICLLITTFLGTQVVGQVTVSCYPTHADCEQDVPRIAHLILPVEGRVYEFRCVLEARAI